MDKTEQRRALIMAGASGIGAVLAERVVEPEDIADTILFLAGPAGRSITGQFIGVDGGFE